jgi:hypothetical protein
MIGFYIVLGLIAIISLAVTIYNISNGLKEAKKELERMEYYES